MKAIFVDKPNADLVLKDVPKPSPRKGEVLIKLSACGVCYRDLVDRKGLYPWIQFPITPGHEFAGTIEACGEDVNSFQVGDRVVNLHRAPCGECTPCQSGEDGRCEQGIWMYGHTAHGGYAEYVIAHPDSLVIVPEKLPLEQAAFLNCTAAVALRALRTRAKLCAGERVLVTGASGGVGLHALMVARNLGAKTVAVTTSSQKVTPLQKFADQVICVPDASFHHQAKALEIDVVLDCVGTPTLNASLRSLKPGGRLVVVGNVNQERFSLNPGYVILFEVKLMGSAVSSRKDLQDVLSWAAEKKIEAHIAQRLPLSKAEEAQKLLREKKTVGRVVLVPDDSNLP